jgi:hypothetical protein
LGTITNTADFRALGVEPPESRGGARFRRPYAEVNMSNSYATGGDTLTGIPVGNGTLKCVTVIGASDKTRNFWWDGSLVTPKIMAESRAGVEVAAATDLSAVKVYVEALIEL